MPTLKSSQWVAILDSRPPIVPYSPRTQLASDPQTTCNPDLSLGCVVLPHSIPVVMLVLWVIEPLPWPPAQRPHGPVFQGAMEMFPVVAPVPPLYFLSIVLQ